LPRFLYNQSNLEEQLEAARILQTGTPPLSVASGKSNVASRLATELYTFSYLIFFSILGTLARLGLQALTFYPGAPVATSVLWPNFAGSFILGFLAEDRRLFREEWGSHKPDTPSFDPKTRDIISPMSEKFNFPNRRGHRDEDQPSQVVSHGRVKKTIPLFIGLATGFCGSFTSFSSFMRDAFFTLSNDLPTPISHTWPQGFNAPLPTDTISRHGGYSVMAVLAVILLTVCLSIGGLRFGAHFAILLDPYLPTFRFATVRRFIDPLFVFIAWGTWIGAIVMCVWPPDRPGGPQNRSGTWTSETWRGQALFACVFAPIGCLIRFYVSIFLNQFSASFPLGTFAINIFGTAVEGMAFDLQHVRIGSIVGGGRVPCQVLQGVQDGFCGSLTTVSTWAAELNGLRRHHAYVYGISSIVGGLSLMVAIMGSVLWTVGWSQPVCIA
jgi:fluoride ion exporter CrcB/FEX